MSDLSFAAGIYRDGPSAEDVVQALAQRGVLQIAERAGLQRRVAVALAEQLKPEERQNFNQALIEVEHTVGLALGVVVSSPHEASGIEGANVVLGKVAERTAVADFDSAVRVLDDALVEIDRLEATQREAAHRKQIVFLNSAIVQHTLRRDAIGVVARIERLVALDDTSDRLASLRARFNEYLAEGDEKGVNLSLLIAVECARRLIEISSQRGRGAAFVDLGMALGTLGKRERGVKHLLEAVEAYREALKELTHNRAPYHWAIVQNNLGVLLCTLGEREAGTERFIEAADACRKALTIRTRERVPLQWATTQNNLGNALSRIGERERGTEHLLEAAKAYRNALEELTGSPIDRAMTQSNLGNVLSALGDREPGTEHLLEAVEVYRDALKIRTRERVPLEWAETKNNLGNALFLLGVRESNAERLVEAVEVCREALEERTRERVPLDWATTHNNLGNALLALGQRESGLGLLHEAIEAYHEALKELTYERVPVEWSKARNNLIIAQTSLNGRLGFNSNTPLSFEEPKQRQNSDLISSESDYTELPGAIAALGQGTEPPREQDLDLSTRARFHALADRAFKRGLSIERFEKSIENELAATEQNTPHETMAHAKVEPRSKLAPAAQVFAAAAAKSSRRNMRHTFSEAELRNPETLNRALDTLADVKGVPRASMTIEQRRACQWADAFAREARKLRIAYPRLLEGELPAPLQPKTSGFRPSPDTAGVRKGDTSLPTAEFTLAEFELVARKDSTLFDRLERFEQRLAEYEVERTKDRATALSSSFSQVRARFRELGLAPPVRPPLVSLADSQRRGTGQFAEPT